MVVKNKREKNETLKNKYLVKKKNEKKNKLLKNTLKEGGIMIQNDLVNPSAENEAEETQENILRPQTLNEYIGQNKVKENMKIYIESAKKRNEPLDHCLFYGPPGLENYTCKYYCKRNAFKNKNNIRAHD